MKILYNIDRFPLVKVLFNDEPDPKNTYYDDFIGKEIIKKNNILSF